MKLTDEQWLKRGSGDLRGSLIATSRGFGIAAGLAACIALAACGPIVGIPGGRLSGTVAPPPADWSFSDAVETFQLETRPDDPYSVNIWGVAVGEHFYIGTSPDTAWSQHIADDPRVRLRVGERLYELRAERAGEDADREAFWAAVKRKYDYEPDPEQMEGGLFFRLVPR